MSGSQSMLPINLARMSGKQKAAVLMVCLGPELAASVFRHLSEHEVEVLTHSIASMPHVTPDMRDAVLSEFYTMVHTGNLQEQAGPGYAQSLLERSLGREKASAIMRRVKVKGNEPPLSVARRAEPGHLAEFIRNEHPQTVAVILAHLRPNQAGAVLSSLPPEKQVEVARRLATLDRTAPDVLQEIENVLQRHLAPLGSDSHAVGGVVATVDVLNRVDRATEKTIMEGLEKAYPELAEEIKKRMFVFEDIVRLDGQSIQRVIREVEAKEWALALKIASEEVSNHVFQNMSKRLADLVREEMSYLGLVRLRDVEEAQQRIVGVIRALEEAGDIVVARSEEDEVFV